MIRIRKQIQHLDATGFKSPAEEYREHRLDIAEQLVLDYDNTYYVQMDSDDMRDFGILKSNLLVVDRSLAPIHGAIILCYYRSEFICRQYFKVKGNVSLHAGETQPLIELKPGEDLLIWGVVVANVNRLLPKQLLKGKYSNVCTC